MGTRCLAHFAHIRSGERPPNVGILCQAQFDNIRSGESPRWRRCSGFLAPALAVILAACSPAAPPVVMEWAEVVAAGTPDARLVPPFDPSQPAVHVLEPRVFRVADAHIQPDPLGAPGIAFRLVEEDVDSFRAWTAARVRKSAAVMLDGRVVTVATVNSPLPGSGIIEFGSHLPEPEELRALVERLTWRE